MSTLLLKGLGEAEPGQPKINVTPNARHSKENPNWVTDDDTLNVERAMWAALNLVIDLDPFSSDIANQAVKALRYYTVDDDGFKQPWNAEALHINHPGGYTIESWRKLVDECRAGRTKRFAWVGFSVEQVCILADPESDDSYPHPNDFSCVYLRKRIPFRRESQVVAGEHGSRPSHANYVCIGGVEQAIVDKFWGGLGRVFHGEFSGVSPWSISGSIGRA